MTVARRAQPARHLVAGEAGHLHVQEDGLVVVLGGGGQPGGAIGRLHHLDAQCPDDLGEGVPCVARVVHHQHGQLRLDARRRFGRATDAFAFAEGHLDGDRRALPQPRIEADAAAHHVDHAAHHRQAQAAAVRHACGVGRAIERLEQARHLVGVDADAGVGDLHGEHAPVVMQLGVDGDAAALGVLDGVGEQVVDDLAQAPRIGVDAPGQFGPGLPVNVEVAQGQGLLDVAQRGIDELVQLEAADAHLEPARGNLGEVDQVADAPAQRARGLLQARERRIGRVDPAA